MPVLSNSVVRLKHTSSENLQNKPDFRIQDGKTLIGGRSKRDQLFIEPTVLGEVDWKSPVMQEEIFGPILPVFKYSDLNPTRGDYSLSKTTGIISLHSG
ncbi:aldehyde dehydrogenase family protein [Paenibacillus sp. JNUCC31]|uniref:aldehyde dehydrogenase family protein n=1 Tax=Paenibacillus sp. JNUCC-31 TaxID=2777983 RepID=UPI00225E5EC4|nr:aldehyde dehydrogenase family protein [Paenibacillus sp. JNUCC-31]